MTKSIEYIETESFQKDLKKLLKRYKSLEDDLEVAKRNAIELFHLQQIDNQSVFPLQKFSSEEIKIYKLKKFACKAIKGRGVQSGIRIIYAHHINASKIEFIEFIEIYFKADQENESPARIKEYLNNVALR